MAFVRTNVSKELIASIIRVERISEVKITLAVTNNFNCFHPDDGVEFSSKLRI
jgi:hypothetical protein